MTFLSPLDFAQDFARRTDYAVAVGLETSMGYLALMDCADEGGFFVSDFYVSTGFANA